MFVTSNIQAFRDEFVQRLFPGSVADPDACFANEIVSIALPVREGLELMSLASDLVLQYVVDGHAMIRTARL